MSIIRSGSIEEEWVVEAELPPRHDRTIYAIAWSSITGMIVSAGSDGKIVVYQEKWQESAPPTDIHSNGEASLQDEKAADKGMACTTWHVAGEVSSAHGPFEVNHVTWARRADRGKTFDQEEVIVSTGDDGSIRVWSLSAAANPASSG